MNGKLQSGESLVLSGISGRFPKANDIDQFWEKLVNREILYEKDRTHFPKTIQKVPKVRATIEHPEYFDNEFFGYDEESADAMDGQLRLLHEVTFEALWDAGIRPETWRGSRTGVFIGSFVDDTDITARNKPGPPFVQCIPTRLSHYYDFKGPCIRVDTACASGLTALHLAIASIQNGDCDQAIVAGVALHQRLILLPAFCDYGILSKSGISGCLDARADGYVRGEAASAVIVQKKSKAKRVYCEIRGIASNTDGYTEEGITFPNGIAQQMAMQEALQMSGTKASEIKYIEAHLTGTQAGDTTECSAIVGAYRDSGHPEDPIYVGALKANIGHTEAASGICAIAKVVKIFQTGSIPPIVPFIPNPKIEPLIRGTIKPILERTEFNGNLIALNSFGYGGANSHVILQANSRSNSENRDSSASIRLINLCNRSQQGIEKTFHSLETNPESRSNEFLSLLDDLSQSQPESGMIYRAYGLIDRDGNFQRMEVRKITKKRPMMLVILNPGADFPYDLSNIPWVKEALIHNSFWESDGDFSANDQATMKMISKAKIAIVFLELIKMLGIEPELVVGRGIGLNLAKFWTGKLTRREAFLHITLESMESNFPKQNKFPQNIFTFPCGLHQSTDEAYDGIFIWPPQTSIDHLSEEWDALVLDQTIYFTRYIDLIEPGRELPLATFIWDTLGSIYLSGHSFSIEKLYPKVCYPVHRKCPSISPLLQWEHTKNFTTDLYPEYLTNPNRTVHTVDLLDPEYSSISGHVIDGQILMPAAAFIYLIAKHLGTYCFKTIRPVTSFSFKLWDLSLSRALKLDDEVEVELTVIHNPATKCFSIQSSYEVYVTGKASTLPDQNTMQQENHSPLLAPDDAPFAEDELNQDEYLQTIKLKAYGVQGKFQSVSRVQASRGYAYIQWKDDWIAFVDSMLQLDYFWEDSKLLRVPTRIKTFQFNFMPFNKVINELRKHENHSIKVTSASQGYIETNGVTISDMSWTVLRRRQAISHPRLACYCYSPRQNNVILTPDEMASLTQHRERCNEAVRSIHGAASKKWKSAEFIRQRMDSKGIQSVLNFPDRALNTAVQTIAENLGTKHTVRIGCVGQSSQDLLKTLDKLFSQMRRSTEISNLQGGNQAGKSPKSASDFDLILYNHESTEFLPSTDLTKELSSMLSREEEFLQPGTFFLVQYRYCLDPFEKMIMDKFGLPTDHIGINLAEIEELNRFDLVRVAQTTIDECCLKFDVYRKPIKLGAEHVKIIPITSRHYEWVQEVQESLINDKITRVWLVAGESSPTGILGMFQCLRLEPQGSKLRCLIHPAMSRDPDSTLMVPDAILLKDLAVNLWKDGSWGTMVLEDIDVGKESQVSSDHYYLTCKRPGMLESLTWTEDDTRYADPDDLIKVHYASINFRDVLIGSALISMEAYPHEKYFELGTDFSGIDAKGRKVIGCVSGRGFSSYIHRKRVQFLILVPDSWDLRDAATLPTCYLTAFYGLVIRGRISRGEKVLIHSGSGGVGLAAISLCISYGCEIFTTVGTVEKKKFVQDMFPQLEESMFLDSRSSSFEEGILRATNGRGVDIVLNSLADDKLRAGLRCLAEGGRFIDISKQDFLQNKPLETLVMDGNRSYETICLVYLLTRIEKDPDFQGIVRKLEQFYRDGFRTGQVKPLPWRVFDKSRVEEAFRFMGRGSHVGKLLIRMVGEKPTQLPPENQTLWSKRTIFNPRKFYLIVGGLGGMGLELMDWMVSRGARKIVISSRSGVKTSYQRMSLQRIGDKVEDEVTILVDRTDLRTYEGSLNCVQKIQQDGPLGGVFNLAVVLRDGLLDRQSSDTFETVCDPKVKITKHMDQISRKECPHMDHFVCFSSIASLGNLGQSNYAFGNSYMERVCEARRRDGLPGLAIQWGPVGDVGIAARIFGDETDSIAGYQTQGIISCLETLDIFLGLPYPVCFSAITSQAKVSKTSDAFTKITRILGLKNLDAIDYGKTLRELGMDSVQAIEIQLFLVNEMRMSINQTTIGQLSLTDVKNMSVEKSSNHQAEETGHKFEKRLLIPLNDKPGTQPIFFFPPAISDFEPLMPLVKRLDCQVIGVNFTDKLMTNPSFDAVTEIFSQAIISSYPHVEKYFFVAYSLGVGMSFDVGRKIQAKLGVERMDRLMFIDISPVWQQGALAFYKEFKASAHAQGIKLQDPRTIGKEDGPNELAMFIEFIDQISNLGYMPKLFREGNFETLLGYADKMISIEQLSFQTKFKGIIILFIGTKQPSEALESINDGVDEIVDGQVERHFLPSNHFQIVEHFPDEIVKVIKSHIYQSN